MLVRSNATKEGRRNISHTNDVSFFCLFIYYIISIFIFIGNDISLYEWQSQRMSNYLHYAIRRLNYKPRWYDPFNSDPKKKRDVEAHHIQRFYGCLLCRNLQGNPPSIMNMYSTRNSTHHIHAIAESMPQDMFRDLHRLIHFVDDFGEEYVDGQGRVHKPPPALLEGEDWSDVYNYEQILADEGTTRHRMKFSHLEEAYNRWWRKCVNVGKWLCMDESRLKGWLKSCMTLGPDPKPIRTGATQHTVCIAEGELSMYKVFARVYGGKADMELKKTNDYTKSALVWINLFDKILEPYKGKGHTVVCDSAYMSDALGMIGRVEWKTNIIGTCQSNRTGAGDGGAKKCIDDMVAGTYDCNFWQHKTQDLVYAAWSDNSIVKTLSNFHSPAIEEATMRRRKRDKKTSIRSMDSSLVPCPVQQLDYSNHFYWIDKGNGQEERSKIMIKTKLHNWAPKLSLRFYNFNENNAYQLYCAMHRTVHGSRNSNSILSYEDCIQELMHANLKAGNPVRQQKAEHPPAVMDITHVHNKLIGRRIRSDRKNDNPTGGQQPRPVSSSSSSSPSSDDNDNDASTTPLSTSKRAQDRRRFNELKWRNDWMVHQCVPVPIKKRARCCYKGCPGFSRTNIKRPEPYTTNFRCQECSVDKECDDGDTDGNLWFCNEVKTVNSNRVAINCHAAYHKSKFGRKKKTTSETFSSPVSSMQQQQKKRRRRATPTTETSILPPLKQRTKITSRTRNTGTVGSVTRPRRNMVRVRNQTFQSPSYITSPTEPATSSSTTTANLSGMGRFV